jgi:putative endonuclease
MEPLGRRGERLAAAYLQAAGCRILSRNWRANRLEIDLVMREGPVIAFVEVKTRRPGPQHPAEAVDRRKRRRLVRAARQWIATHPEPAVEYRFDVVSVLVDGRGRARVQHRRDAFTGDDG